MLLFLQKKLAFIMKNCDIVCVTFMLIRYAAVSFGKPLVWANQ